MADLPRNLTTEMVQRGLDGHGRLLEVVPLLAQNTRFLQDIPFAPTNMQLAHKVVQETSKPNAKSYALGAFVEESMGEVSSVIFDTMKVADSLTFSPEVYTGMRKEDQASEFAFQVNSKMEAINTRLVSQFIYGGNDNSTSIKGFMHYYNKVSGGKGTISDRVFDGGGTSTDNRSILIVGWSNDTIHGIYPNLDMWSMANNVKSKITKGEIYPQIPLVMTSDGATQYDSTRNASRHVQRLELKTHAGLCLRDWRYAARICNLSISAIKTDLATAGNRNSPDVMALVLEAKQNFMSIPGRENLNYVLYMPLDLSILVNQQIIKSVSQSTLDGQSLVQDKIERITGYKTVLVDAMAVDEARVV